MSWNGRRCVAAVSVAFLAVAAVLAWGAGSRLRAATPSPFLQLPAGHWTYTAFRSLAGTGLLEGYPAEGFGTTPERTVTRYEMAVLVVGLLSRLERSVSDSDAALPEGFSLDRLIAAYNHVRGDKGLAPKEIRLVERLVEEFQGELGALGYRVPLPGGGAAQLKVPDPGSGEPERLVLQEIPLEITATSRVGFDSNLRPGAEHRGSIQGEVKDSLRITLDWMERNGLLSDLQGDTKARLSVNWSGGGAVLGDLPPGEKGSGVRFFGREEALQGLQAAFERGNVGTSVLIAERQSGPGTLTALDGSVRVTPNMQITGTFSRAREASGLAHSIGVGTVVQIGRVELDAQVQRVNALGQAEEAGGGSNMITSLGLTYDLSDAVIRAEYHYLDLDQLAASFGLESSGTSVAMNLPNLAPGLEVKANFSRGENRQSTSLRLGYTPSEDASVSLGYQLVDFNPDDSTSEVTAELTMRF